VALFPVFAAACGVSPGLPAGGDDPSISYPPSPPPPPAGDASPDRRADVSDAGAHDGAPAAEAAAGGCIGDPAPGHHVYTCNGIAMDVEIPSACAAPRACGLIVDAHGLTMNALMENDNTNMRALGDKYGYVVVQPNAPGPLAQWDHTNGDPVLYDFLVYAIARLAIDPKRVHMTGFSDGGDTSLRFLCKHADLFASVAPAAGEGCSFTPGDIPSREIPILYMHGTQDLLEDFQTIGLGHRDAIVSAWKMGTGQIVAQGTGYVRTRWTSPSGTVFEFLQHDYTIPIVGGHCFPGSTDKGDVPGQLVPLGCDPPNGFTWGEEVMTFFRAHE